MTGSSVGRLLPADQPSHRRPEPGTAAGGRHTSLSPGPDGLAETHICSRSLNDKPTTHSRASCVYTSTARSRASRSVVGQTSSVRYQDPPHVTRDKIFVLPSLAPWRYPQCFCSRPLPPYVLCHNLHLTRIAHCQQQPSGDAERQAPTQPPRSSAGQPRSCVRRVRTVNHALRRAIRLIHAQFVRMFVPRCGV
ncbi:hypothetical protein BD309DRAFT_950744 [Dichomitus squalens]|nr:hypothetical protein BD309DRAFT_950744 [Dichomitus squalens]